MLNNMKELMEKMGLGDLRNLFEKSPRLIEFDPWVEYAYGQEMHPLINAYTHRVQTGRAANLLRRMKARGAMESELVDGLRHLWVIIDAMKYDLNWKKSREDHHIRDLERKYPRR